MSTAAYVPLSTIEEKLDIRSPFTYGTPYHISPFTYSGQGGEKKRCVKGLAVDGENQEILPLPCVMLIAMRIITFLSLILAILTFPVSGFFIIKVVHQYERLVVFRLGHYHSTRTPGITIVLPCVDRCHHIDVRVKAFNVPPTQVLLADSALITVGATVYFTVQDPLSTVLNVQDFNHSTRTLAQAAFHSILPNHRLPELDSEKQQIVESLKDLINEGVTSWGLNVSSVETSPVTVLKKPNPASAFGPDLTPVLQILNSYISGTMTGGLTPLQGGLNMVPGMPSIFPAISEVPELIPADTLLDVEGGGSGHPLPDPPISDTLPSTLSGSTINPMIVLGLVSKVIDASLVESVNAVYMFSINGESAGNYILDLKHGSGSVTEWDGMLIADCIISLSSSDMCELLLGQLSPFNGYISGRISIEGDVTIAIKLKEVYTRMSQIRHSNVS